MGKNAGSICLYYSKENVGQKAIKVRIKHQRVKAYETELQIGEV